NDKVRALAEQVKADGGVMPGIITLGVVDGVTYLIDGQHRRESSCAHSRASSAELPDPLLRATVGLTYVMLARQLLLGQAGRAGLIKPMHRGPEHIRAGR